MSLIAQSYRSNPNNARGNRYLHQGGKCVQPKGPAVKPGKVMILRPDVSTGSMKVAAIIPGRVTRRVAEK